MAYTFDAIYAVDPNNTANVAKNASITIFDPADATQAPITITDPTGVPLPNPITVDAAGMGPAFQHPTLARVGWKGAGFTNYFTSYEGMYNETQAAKTAAQASASAASTAVGAVVTAAAVNGSGRLILTKADTTTVDAGAVIGPTGPKGDKGADGSNVLPTDTAIKNAITTPGTETATALNATIATATSGKLDATAAASTYATQAALATAQTPRRYSRPQFRTIPGGSWSFPAGLDAGATLNTAYADVNPLGTTAAQVLTAGAGSPVLRQTFTAPVDMTGKQWILWVKLPDMTLTKNLVLYAYDTTLTSANMWTFPVYGPVSTLNSPKYVIHPNVWTPLVVPWDPTTVAGTPNRAAVNRVHLALSDNATGTPVEFRVASKVGMVDVAPAFTSGAVSITIDDSVSLDVVKPKLTQYGYPATLFPIGETLGTGVRPTVTDLRTLVNNLGWEVAAHAASTADHVSVEDLSQADRLANFGRVKQWHSTNGFPTDIYGWPNGTSSEQAFDDLRGFYSVARGVGTGWLETLPPGRPEYLRTVVVSAATTAATINGLVDRAVAANCWLILCFHSVVTSGATGQATNQAVFDAIIDYIATKNTKVLTVGDVMAKV